MSTLVIEGGRRIEGRVDVEGNKNAALPLMAACLLTDEWCTLHQRAAHRRRRGDGAAAARSRRRGRRHRQHDAAHPLRATSPRTSPTARWSAGCAARCCCWARCWRAAAAPSSRRRAAISRRGARIQTHLEALDRHGRARRPGLRAIVSRSPDGLKPASIYLDEASVTGTETALLAAAAAPGVSEIRHAACEPHVVELCEFLRGMGVGITGEGSHTIRVEGGIAKLERREQDALRRLHRGGQLGGGRRHHRRGHRGRRHAAGGHGSGRLGAHARWT